jgi:sarcosine oxidase
MTPDETFIIDRLPDAPQVVIASPCSGHGFKFAPLIGEAVAALALGAEPPFDLAKFSLDRFSRRASDATPSRSP